MAAYSNKTRTYGVLAFQLAGSYFGPVGTIVGGIIGNAIFGSGVQKAEGPKLTYDAMKAQNIEYNVNINEYYGTTKGTGTVIWATDLEERSTTTFEDSGKGGDSGTETTTYSYYTNLAILLQNGFLEGVRKMFANDEVVFDLSETNIINSGCFIEDLYEGTVKIGKKIILNGKYKGEIYFYNSLQTIPNFFIEANSPNSPAYSGYSYILLKGFGLKQFNEYMPQFNFELVNSSEKDSEDVVFDLNSFDLQKETYNTRIAASKYDDYLYVLSPNNTSGITNGYLHKIDTISNQIIDELILDNIVGNNITINFINNGNILINSGNLGSFLTIDTKTMRIIKEYNNHELLQNYPYSNSIQGTGEKWIYNKNGFFNNYNSYFNIYEYSDAIVVHEYYNLENDIFIDAFFKPTFSRILKSNIINYNSNQKSGWSNPFFTQYVFDTANNSIYTYTKENSNSGKVFLSRIFNGYNIDYMYLQIFNESTNVEILDLYFDDISRCIFIKYRLNSKNYMMKFDIDNNILISNTLIQIDLLANESVTKKIEANNSRTFFMTTRNNTTNISKVLYYNMDSSQIKILDKDFSANEQGNNPIQVLAFNSKLNTEYYLKNTGTNTFNILKNFGMRYYKKGYNLKKFIELLSERVLIKKEQLILDDLTNDEILGYEINNDSNVSNIIQQLAPIFNFSCIESDYKIKFVKNGKAPIATIYKKDLGVQNYGQNLDFKELLITNKINEKELPNEVNITYYNERLNYANDTQTANVINTNSINKFDINIPIVLNENVAKSIAYRLIDECWTKQYNFEFSTNYNYHFLEPLDNIFLDYDGIKYLLKIEQIEKQGGIIKFKCSKENLNIYNQNKVAQITSNIGDIQVKTLSNTSAIFFDLPALSNKHLEDGGYYMSNLQDNFSLFWKNSSTFLADDELERYTLLQQFNKQIVFGKTLNKLDYLNIKFDEKDNLIDNTIDYYNYVDVKILNGQLNNCSITQLTNTKNLALINHELIQFLNADLIEENTYRLTGLLRARFNTDIYIKNHIGNDAFYLINLDSSVQNINDEIANIKKINTYKTITHGQRLNDVNIQQFYNSGARLNSYKINNLFIERQINNDFNISFLKLIRGYNKTLQLNKIDIDGDNYALYILNSDETIILNSYNFSGLNYTYTIEQQNIDFNNVSQTQINAVIIKYNKFNQLGVGFKCILK